MEKIKRLPNSRFGNTLQKQTIKDREHVSNSFKLLSEIGQQITHCLSLEKIIETVYGNVNKLMDASSFWIGIYNEPAARLEYPIGKEKGKTISFAYYDLSDDKWLAVHSFKTQKELFVNDYKKEYNNYIPNLLPPVPIAGEMPESSIWFPLISQEKKPIGILTIQSFNKNAYTKYHLDIVRNLAVFISIALENALLYGKIEQKVKERTNEIVKKKEEVEQSYLNVKLLSEIGKKITSSLSIEKIIESTHQNINCFLDATVFAIGLYNETEKRIDISYAIEENKKLPTTNYCLTDDKRLAVWCFNNQKEIIINNIQREYNNYIPNSPIPKPKIGKNSESILYLPLISKKNKALGIITVQSFRKDAYTDNHLNLIRNIAVFLTIAVENALTYEQVEQRVAERTKEVVKQKEEIKQSYQNVKLLSEIGQTIVASLSVEKIIETTYENVNKLMDASGFGIGILDKEGKTLLFPLYIEEGKKLKMVEFSTSDKNRLAIWCLDNNKRVLINDFQFEVTNFIKVIQKPLAGRSVNSVIYLPLELNEKVIGVVTVQSFHKNAFSENHIDFLKNIAVFAEIALENALLYENLEEKVRERTTEVLMQKNNAEAQKDLVEEKNRNIIDSINYAKRIQNALLKEENHVSDHLPSHYILFKPKDIISGDFYWSLEKKGHLYLVAADCTGHGVPGAMMSMLGIAFLNEINSTSELLSPATILNKLRDLVVKELSQTGQEGTSSDGMDISMARLNLTNNELQWSGANNPLYLIKNNELQEIKPNKQPIGIHYKMEPFSNHTIPLEKGTSFYLFTDGFADQFGGPRGKKIKHSYLMKILLSIDQKPMIEQKNILNNYFENWKGDLDQVDDVCIIGMKI